jgi:hypothetical protein
MKLRAALSTGLLALLGGLATVMPAAAETASPAAVWVVDPAVPGANLPPLGRSLFDQIFAVDRDGRASLDLPFPFEALLKQLDGQLAADPNSALPPTKRVLIPLGRSLQRTAAAPDYFAFPRVVAAVDSESAAISTPYLKDRLYLGYQEKSSVLEVISYNELGGRFEFQLVKDYRAGGKPQVFYANRSLCFACHQNGSPIFSRPLWDETNANPQTAALLGASRQRFYGIAVERGVDNPYAIDLATEHANGFALTQRLWQEGCGDTDLPARRCRAGLYAAALRHVLSGGQTWVPDASFEQLVSARLRTEARRRWPGGLAIGNPDLPNRNPLQGMKAWPIEQAARIAFSHVPAPFEPLAPRPPRAIWQAGAADALSTLVNGLADFISEPARRQLANTLAGQGVLPSTQVRIPCRVSANTPASRWSIQCAAPAGERGPSLAGSLTLRGGRFNGGQLTRLTLPGGTALNNLDLNLLGPATAQQTSFRPISGKHSPRTAEGHAINRLLFRPISGDPTRAEIVLDIGQEFVAIEQALATLAESVDGETLFGPGPFPRVALHNALLGKLGAAPVPPCCNAAQNLPPPQMEVTATTPGSGPSTPLEPALQAFQPYCATCHQTAEHFPPNFLSGNASQVAAQLRQCAPRLFVRLSMADIAPDQRDKTPMPPENMLPAFASNPALWRASPARAALLAQVGDWLRQETGQPASLNQLLAGGYEALRPCLPVQ